MNKEEFLKKLKDGIRDIPKDEQDNILDYYNEYFEDAQDDEKVINELGNPSKIVAQIKGEYTIKNIENKIKSKKEEEKKQCNNSVFKSILIVILAIFAAPIATPIALAIFLVLFSFVVVLGSVALALAVAGIAVILAGVVMIIAGFVKLFVSFPIAVILIGAGLIVTSITAICLKLLVKICKELFAGLVKIVKRIIKRGE